MKTPLVRVDPILRGEMGNEQSSRQLISIVSYIGIYGGLYGAVMGTFGGFGGDRAWQVLYSAVKVPFLLLVTFLISLPSFFVLHNLFGMRRDFAEAASALIRTQAGLAITLASMAPLTVVWYASSASYSSALLVNMVCFAVAGLGSQILLRKYYRPLIARNRKHRWMLLAWILVYGFVGIQMGWILRPFVGSPDLEVTFFRRDAWGNAYEVVARLIRNAIFPA